MTVHIAFNRPAMPEAAFEYLRQAVGNGHLSGDGPFTKQCNAVLQDFIGAPKVLLTTSCTHALEMAALLLDVGPGDEVVVPSFTFVSTVNAFVLRGARPVFADIRPDTLNLDEERLESLIGPRTKAIVVVHYAGVACEMDLILAIAARHRLPVVEDNAHGLWGAYRGRPLGTLGPLATLSFHETKNITCGEGGALLVNDAALADRAEILREKGTNRSRFFRGQVDKYSWVDLGSSYLPSDLLAAVLCAQLEAADDVQQARQRLWHRYADALAEWAADSHIRLPVVPESCTPAYHMFHMLMPTEALRDDLIAYLKSRGIWAVFHYLPLHVSTMGRQLGGRPGDCPVTEEISGRLIRLPFFTNMTAEEQREIVEAVTQFVPARSERAR